MAYETVLQGRWLATQLAWTIFLDEYTVFFAKIWDVNKQSIG